MTPKKFGIFIAISLLLHLLLLLILAFGWIHQMSWRTEPPKKNTIRLTLAKRPPPPLPEPLQQTRPFVDTTESIKQDTPDPSAVFQGAENTRALSTESPRSNSPIPNLTGEQKNSLNLRNSNYSPQINSNPSLARKNEEQEKPREKQEEQKEKKGSEKTEAQTGRPLDLHPDSTFLTREEEQERKKLLEEKRKELEARDASQSRAPPMAFSAEKRQSQFAGGAERGTVDSFGAQQTELGRYKQKLYRAIGSRWYVYVEESSGFISVGQIKIRFYVRADGGFERLQVISGDNTSQLYVISRRSIMENSGQLEPFSESMRAQLGDGYWEEISFTIR